MSTDHARTLSDRGSTLRGRRKKGEKKKGGQAAGCIAERGLIQTCNRAETEFVASVLSQRERDVSSLAWKISSIAMITGTTYRSLSQSPHRHRKINQLLPVCK